MTKSRIFLALDGMSVQRAQAISSLFAEHVAGGKATDLIDEAGAGVLDNMNFRLRFLDPKINDIEATVGNRVARYAGHADYITLHASMSPKALRLGAKIAKEQKIKPLAVTVLTDIDKRHCRKNFGRLHREAVIDFAMKGIRAGCVGIICSPQEAGFVRRAWPAAIIITPGVRLAGSDPHDQKRVGTPYQAIVDGATYIVCGREILHQDTIEQQMEVIERINEEVRRALLHLSA